MEFFEVILSSGVGAGVMAILLAWFQRKWKKEDTEDSRITALVEAQKVIMIDRVRLLGRQYIEAGSISLEDKENFRAMYSAYKALGGNGHLDTVLSEVEKLKVVGHD